MSDMTTAMGRLFYHVIGSFAEFEREMIVERVRAGLANARAKGKRLGRCKVTHASHGHPRPPRRSPPLRSPPLRPLPLPRRGSHPRPRNPHRKGTARSTAEKDPAEAVAHIRESRKGVTLGGLRIKDLIYAGHKY